MGYKAPAVHRTGAYSTDCKCKHNHFAQFREARMHCDACFSSLHVIYHERAGGDRVVYDKVPDAR